MKALNAKERNSAILKFALWLLVCVLVISLPIIISSFISSEKQNVLNKENENLIEDINFEREYFAVQIQKILDLMRSKEANKINSDTFNAELMNVVNDIKKQTEQVQEWRGDMYRNTTAIAEFLVSANKVMSSSADSKDKQLSDLNKIILEFESCNENLVDLGGEKKRDIYEALDEVEEQFNRALKMLNNYKSTLR